MYTHQKIDKSNERLKRNLKGTLPLLALLTAFPALSTDMILPAVPSLARTWNQPLSVINLILVCFFITYGFFLSFTVRFLTVSADAVLCWQGFQYI